MCMHKPPEKCCWLYLCSLLVLKKGYNFNYCFLNSYSLVMKKIHIVDKLLLWQFSLIIQLAVVCGSAAEEGWSSGFRVQAGHAFTILVGCRDLTVLCGVEQ